MGRCQVGHNRPLFDAPSTESIKEALAGLDHIARKVAAGEIIWTSITTIGRDGVSSSLRCVMQTIPAELILGALSWSLSTTTMQFAAGAKPPESRRMRTDTLES